VHLLSLGLRILTLIEFVVRRQLKAQGDSLVGLHLENLKGSTTTERLLKAFDNLSLPSWKFAVSSTDMCLLEFPPRTDFKAVGVVP